MIHDVIIPVALFVHSRVYHLSRTLDSLKTQGIPLLYVFADGSRGDFEADAVARVRAAVRKIDWCEVKVCERDRNFGLGRSVLTGVTEVLLNHPAAIVFEDDLIARPGTYAYMASALRWYANEARVMSVTAWSHPRITPLSSREKPYFDGRAECWGWGTWARAWGGMDVPACEKLESCRNAGIDIYRYGSDLPVQAEDEQRRNIWAVRWLYHHRLHGGLCLRPSATLVNNIGNDGTGTNTRTDAWQQLLSPLPVDVPCKWPEVSENPECEMLWRSEYGGRPGLARRFVRAFRKFKRACTEWRR